MGGGDLNTKKSWHPNTMKNQERVWKAEQQEAAEKRRLHELRREIDEERNREELKSIGQRSGILPSDEGDKKLEWMYRGPSQLVNREEYLLGRTIDKTFEELDAQEKASNSTFGVAQPKNHVEHECIPFSIRQHKDVLSNDQVDLARKLMEDPLMLIKQKEMESRQKILQNPVKLKELHRLLKGDQSLKASAEEKKGRKKEKKSKKSKKSQKKKKKSKKYSDSSESEGSDSEGSADLDKLLAEKYKKVARDQQEGVSIDKLLSMKFDKLSQELDVMGGGGGGSKKKKQRRGESSDSSESDKKGSRKRVDSRHEKRDERVAKSRERGRNTDKDSRSRGERKGKRGSSDGSTPDRNKHDRLARNSGRDRSRERYRNKSPVRTSNRSPVRKAYPTKDKHSRGRSRSRSEERKKGKDDKRRSRSRSRSVEKKKVKDSKRRSRSRSRSVEKKKVKDSKRRSRSRSRSVERKKGKDDKRRSRSRSRSVERKKGKDSKRRSQSRSRSVERKKVKDSNRRSRSRSPSMVTNRAKNANRHARSRSTSAERKKGNDAKVRSRSRSPRKRSYTPTNQKSSTKPRREPSSSSSSSDDSDTANQPAQSRHQFAGDSDDERRIKKIRNFGLVTASGEKLDTSSSSRPEVRLYNREEIKAEQSKQRPTWTKPTEKKRPLSEKELEEKRLAMMSNAQWRDKERESNVKRYESEDHREEATVSREYDKEFLTKQFKRAAASETVESRIRSNRNNIQRSNGAMDRNFVKR